MVNGFLRSALSRLFAFCASVETYFGVIKNIQRPRLPSMKNSRLLDEMTLRAFCSFRVL